MTTSSSTHTREEASETTLSDHAPSSPAEQIAELQRERARLQAEYQAEVKRGDSVTAQRLKAQIRTTLDALEVLTDVHWVASQRAAVSTRYEHYARGLALGREYAADALDELEKADHQVEELAATIERAVDLLKRGGAAISSHLSERQIVSVRPEQVRNILNQRLIALGLSPGSRVNQDLQRARLAVGAMEGLDHLIRNAVRYAPTDPDDTDSAA